MVRGTKTETQKYPRSTQFSTFIPPGRYSVAHPRDTKLHYLAEFTGVTLRLVRMPPHRKALFEIELTFRDSRTSEATRLVFGGLGLKSLPASTPAHYDKGWKAPMGIGNPSFFESYDEVLKTPPSQRSFYGFHLDAQNRWIDHHAVGVDGPLLHRDADDPSKLHLYLLSYERHSLLNHFVLKCPEEACLNRES